MRFEPVCTLFMSVVVVTSSASADMTGWVYQDGYAWSGTDFGGTAVGGYVVDLYLEFDNADDVLLNIFNFNDINLGTTYHQGLTAPGWAPNEQGGIFQTEVSRQFDSFIAIGGVTEYAGNGKPYQMAGNGVAVDPNFGGNFADGPAANGGWYNGAPTNLNGAVVATPFTSTGLAVFIGRFSILGSDGFSMACPEGAATYNQGIGTPGIQQNFATWPTPGPLALMGVACFLRPRRR